MPGASRLFFKDALGDWRCAATKNQIPQIQKAACRAEAGACLFISCTCTPQMTTQPCDMTSARACTSDRNARRSGRRSTGHSAHVVLISSGRGADVRTIRHSAIQHHGEAYLVFRKQTGKVLPDSFRRRHVLLSGRSRSSCSDSLHKVAHAPGAPHTPGWA
jgi:hypothetical protein